ncbi:TIGR03503 family protein [Alishewanella sp. HL-SH05]|uniref:TIGR03503 family protein n=1 Tax=Alishewanella sp. HL-SH05 TaxID=3461145 RepID=UPI004042FE9F
MARLMLLCFMLCNLFVLTVAAQQDSTLPVATPESAPAQTPEPLMRILADLPLRNQIPLLDNRFRIDDGIESITLVFFRRPGSASIVLVRPDGSKVFYNTAKQNNIRWFDGPSYDLIEITQPMPGPWQAVGRVLPESKILVLTDVALDVDPLPKPMVVGETFKLTARMLQDGKAINAREFKDILSLQVVFTSTNDKRYENFGRGMVEVANFRDDGRGYDISARDGIFTGEINLVFGQGEWIPRFIVRTPLYTREVEQSAVIIEPSPITLNVQMATTAEQSHIIMLDANSDLVDVDSLLFQGQIQYPDGDMQSFSLVEPTTTKQLQVDNRGHGSYILNMAVFGQMRDGREFVLNLPEERFLVAMLAQEAPDLGPADTVTEAAVEVAEPVATEVPWLWIILINLFILVLGAVAIWFVLSGKQFSRLMFWRKKTEPAATAAGNKTATAAKVDSTANKKSAKKKDGEDILDLSMPDG